MKWLILPERIGAFSLANSGTIIKTLTALPVNTIKTILYADDDTDDKTWVREACKAINCELDIAFVENGRQALDYLEANKHRLPSLIVLDLNMPELDGRQTLQKLKANSHYKSIPVAIVTTSANKIDKEICKRLGAELYLTKPDSHTEWQNVIRNLQPFVS